MAAISGRGLISENFAAGTSDERYRLSWVSAACCLGITYSDAIYIEIPNDVQK
jgi:hypothetical protein